MEKKADISTNISVSSKKKFAKRLQNLRCLSPNDLLPEQERYTHSIMELKPGGFIKFENSVFRVKDISTYRETDTTYRKELGSIMVGVKLFCVNTGDMITMSMKDDTVITAGLTTRQVRFKELDSYSGDRLDEDDLDQICSDEDAVYYYGDGYHYNNDWAARHYKGGDTEGEPVYIYGFAAEDGTYLRIEKRMVGDREKYEVYLNRTIDPDSIEILALGK